MGQQEKENSPIPSSEGIPAFASIILFLVGFYVLVPLSGIILSSIPVLREWGMGAFFIGEGAMLLSVSAVTFLTVQLPDHRLFSDLGFSLEGCGKDILYGFLMTVPVYAIGFAVCLLTGRIEVIGVRFRWNDLPLSGLSFAMVATVEETIMHGHILGCLLHTRLNKFISLFISSLLFALPRLMNPNVAFLPILNPVLGRLLLGAAYLYTYNLWFPIPLHLFWDWIQGPVLEFKVSSDRLYEALFSLRLPTNNLINGGAFDFEGSLVRTILAALSTLLVT